MNALVLAVLVVCCCAAGGAVGWWLAGRTDPDRGLGLHERSLPYLRERAVDNPGLAALLDEVERGRQRQDDGR